MNNWRFDFLECNPNLGLVAMNKRRFFSLVKDIKTPTKKVGWPICNKIICTLMNVPSREPEEGYQTWVVKGFVWSASCHQRWSWTIGTGITLWEHILLRNSDECALFAVGPFVGVSWWVWLTIMILRVGLLVASSVELRLKPEALLLKCGMGVR